MQMKMEKKVKKFDRNKVKKLLEDENEYIVDLLTTCDVPDSVEDLEYDAMFLLDSNKKKQTINSDGPTIKDFNKTKRAQTADELEERLNIIKNKMKTKKNKITEKSAKRREMKKLKKNKEVKKILVSAHKSMKNEKQKGYKPEKQQTDNTAEDDKKDIKPLQARPIFNEEGKIVFSKFDFAAHPGAKLKKGRKDKVVKNPEEILKKMKETKRKIAELNEQGDEDKARELTKELAWQKVFDKVEGKSVRDDPTQLLKSIKRKRDTKKKSKQKWQERKDKVEADIAGRQKKRQENIDKRNKERKSNKMKKLSKRGRIIPGFS